MKINTTTLFFIFSILLLSCGKDDDLKNEIFSPTAATLLSPNNLELCTTGTVLSDTKSEVLFIWEESKNTTSYEIHIINLSSEIEDVFTTENTQISLTIDRGSPYNWYVLSKTNSSANVAKSSVWAFYNAGLGIENHIPFPATAISPELGENITGNSINLEWSTNDIDNDVVGCDLYFGSSANPPLFQNSITNDFISNINISSGTTYYWKIVTKDSVGNESESSTFYFLVD